MHPFVVLAPFVLLAAPAAGPEPLAAFQKRHEERARADAQDLLRTLCPEQCVLVSVEVRAEEEPVEDVQPGFEEATPKAPVLRAVRASVLVDAALPQAFRARVETLVVQRLRALGAPARVAVEAVAFPPRLSAQAAPAAAAPSAPPIVVNVPAPQMPQVPTAAPQPAPSASAGERARDSLADAAPLLALGALAVLALGAVAALFLLALRRFSREAPAARTRAAEDDARPRVPERSAFDEARRARLLRAVAASPDARAGVVRDALSRGEARLVALWAREVGEALFEGARGDPGFAAQADVVSAELSRVPPPTDDETASAMAVLEGRLLAAKLSQSAGEGQPFAFLAGVPPEAFADAVEELAHEDRGIALRAAPALLRSSALARLSAPERAALADLWASAPRSDEPRALAAADALRSALAETERRRLAASALAELLAVMPRPEQDAAVERLRREGSALVDDLLTESALEHAPSDLLAAAVLGAGAARAALFLASTANGLRDKVLDACPPRLRRDLEEELESRDGATNPELADARRAFVQAVSQELSRRGLSARHLRRGGAGS